LTFGFYTVSFSQEKTEKLPSVGDALYDIINTKGVEAALAEYDKLKKKSADKYNFDEWQLNKLGYRLLEEKKFDEAKAVLLKNIEQFPDAPNPYDSYAEACMMSGDKQQAIEYYKKSLEKLKGESIDAETKEWLGNNTQSKLALLDGRATAFSWYPGSWEIRSSSLGKDGVWTENEATSTVTAHADGYLLVGDYSSKYLKGTTLLSYNTKTDKWEMTWFDNAAMTGFEVWEGMCVEGECIFISKPKPLGEKTKINKARWYNIKDGSASWEEAQSFDGGKSWEVKLKMEYKRKTAQ
jgi:tetratricopeptide (TPR) repeat protein